MFCLRNTKLAWTGKDFDYINDRPWYPPVGKASSFRNLDALLLIAGCNKDRDHAENKGL